jgi:hypothetical protein
MEKKILIVQSNPRIFGYFQNLMLQEHPKIAKDALYAESFHEAIGKTPKECELIVISSNSFKSPDHNKNGAMLAEEIKRINSNTRFYIFSKYQPEKSEFVDDFVLKNQFGDIETADILDILGKI